MRKAAIIFFIIMLSGNSLLSVVAFKYGQKQIKREIKKMIFSGIDPARLECIALPEKDLDRPDDIFQFVDKNEFKYYGRMYDIVRRETRGDTVYFYSIRDEKEEKLIADFLLEMKNNHDTNTVPRKDKLLKLLTFSLECVENDTYCEHGIFSLGKHSFVINSENTISNNQEVPSPPPKY